MYDNVYRFTPSLWFRYRGYKFVSFSKIIHQMLLRLGIRSLHIQYFVDPLALPRKKSAEGISCYFWERTKYINWKTIKKLIGTHTIDRFFLMQDKDPGQPQLSLQPEELTKYKIVPVRWSDTREEYLETLKLANVYFAPRLYEGIGMTFLEAMAMGLCVIAPDRPVMNEYIKNGQNGILYDPTYPKEIDFSDINEIGYRARDFMLEGHNKWQSNLQALFSFLDEPIDPAKEKPPFFSIFYHAFLALLHRLYLTTSDNIYRLKLFLLAFTGKSE
ncbi:MAG: glycosyltransferase [Deltaproteobacteria bacterium]|nr:glycosyltransferase [Deltaproteobacteria bacterium]